MALIQAIYKDRILDEIRSAVQPETPVQVRYHHIINQFRLYCDRNLY
jgi:hypothetical protein